MISCWSSSVKKKERERENSATTGKTVSVLKSLDPSFPDLGFVNVFCLFSFSVKVKWQNDILTLDFSVG